MGFGIRYATSSPYWQYYYFGKNIQGDVIALYRSDYNSSSQSYYPTLVATYSYDPWGTPTGIYDANGNAISQTAYHLAVYNPFRYRGYRYDGDTRLYYLQSRYYDPAVGRFINADSPNFALTNPYSNGITDKNYFVYCDNNPISRGDDGGEFWSELLTGVAVAAGITAVAAFVVATGGVGAMAVAGGGAVLSGAVTSTTAMAISVGAGTVSVSAGVYAQKFKNVETVLPQRSTKNPFNSKGGKQNIRDSGLVGVSDAAIEAKLKNPNTTRAEKQRLKKAIQKLSEKEQWILSMRFDEELTYKQIAQQIGVKPQNIGGILERIYKHLRRILEEVELN